jgi:hypothetical protein
MEIETLAPRVSGRFPFTRVLNSIPATVPEVLSHPMTFPLFRDVNRSIIDLYFFLSHTSLVQHIHDLLALVFSSDDRCLGGKAFAIFEYCNPDVTTALVVTGEFPKIASRVFATEPDLLQLNRLASVTASVLAVNLTLISSTCSFVMKFIPYMAELSVLHLFEYLCRASEPLRAAQLWMLEAGFIRTIVREIDKAVDGDRRLWAMLHMLRYCTGSPVFVEPICSYKVVSVLNQGIGNYPQFIEDARWMVLGSIYCGRTSEMMRGLFQSAIEVILDPKTCRTESAYAALRVLQKMLAQDRVLQPFIAESGLCKIVMNLLILNPDHSILQNGGRLLVVEMFDSPHTRARAIEDCLPTLIAARSMDNRALRASMYAIVRMLLKSRNGVMDVRNVPGFIDLVKAVRQQTDLMNAAYGGMTPV